MLYINTRENKDIFMGMEKVSLQLGKEIIAWTRASGRHLIASRPLKVNIAGLKYIPVLEKDIIQIDKVKIAKDKLTKVLCSEYCPMPDFMSRIPKCQNEEETVKLLTKMFEDSKFFSRISTCEEMYGKNFEFAEMVSQLSKQTSNSISEGKSFEDVLRQIANGYSKETTINTEYLGRFGESGRYRGNIIEPPEYLGDYRLDGYSTRYGDSCFGAYKEYAKRLDLSLGDRATPYENFKLTRKPLTNEYISAFEQVMVHPYNEEVAKNMEIISERYKIYQNLVNEYKVNCNLTLEQKKQADGIISEIYYLMANTCPFFRGSNGISDVLMRSQYSALGINKPHVKQGVGLDLEAFCMNLDEYKLKWNTFFE